MIVSTLTTLTAAGSDAITGLGAHVAHAATSTVSVLAEGIDVKSTAPPGAEKFLRLLGWLKWVVYIVGVGALIGAGAIFAVEKYQDRGDSKAAKICLWVIIGAIISVMATGIIDAATA